MTTYVGRSAVDLIQNTQNVIYLSYYLELYILSNFSKTKILTLICCNQIIYRASTYDTPAEFLPLLDKQFLLKVEVSDANTVRGFQTYVVKKLTADVAIIQKFMQKHGIDVRFHLFPLHVMKTSIRWMEM